MSDILGNGSVAPQYLRAAQRHGYICMHFRQGPWGTYGKVQTRSVLLCAGSEPPDDEKSLPLPRVPPESQGARARGYVEARFLRRGDGGGVGPERGADREDSRRHPMVGAVFLSHMVSVPLHIDHDAYI